MNTLHWLGVVGALIPAALSSTTLAGQRVTYSGSLSYAGGSYVFDEEVNSFYVGNALSLATDRLRLTVDLPVIVQNGGIVSYVAGIPVPTGGSQHGLVQRRRPGETLGTQRRSKGGGSAGGGASAAPASLITLQDDSILVFDDSYSANVGDPTLSGSVELSEGIGAIRSLTVDASVKAPLTSVEDGVGSGEWDYSLGGGVALAVGSGMVFADARYWWLGDMPDLELVDGFSYGLGASLPFADSRGSALLSLSGMSAIIETMDAPISLSGSVGYRVRDPLFLSAGLSVGLTESASDFVVYVGWSVGGEPGSDERKRPLWGVNPRRVVPVE
jgi:hypothetical protein